MKKERFEKFMNAVKEGAEYLKGEVKPFVEHETRIQQLEIMAVCKTLKCSKNELAGMLGVSLQTLQKWEKTRRVPKGPAQTLLKIMAAPTEQATDVSVRISEIGASA